MFLSAFILSVLVVGSGYYNKLCQLSCPAGTTFAYNIVVIFWLLQYDTPLFFDELFTKLLHAPLAHSHPPLRYVTFCLYWGTRVMRSVTSAQGLTLTGINGTAHLLPKN